MFLVCLPAEVASAASAAAAAAGQAAAAAAAGKNLRVLLPLSALLKQHMSPHLQPLHKTYPTVKST